MTIIFLISIITVFAICSMLKVFNELKKDVSGIADTSFIVIFALTIIATFTIFIHYSFLIWDIINKK